MNVEAEIDGGRKNYRAEANDMVWAKYAESFGPTAIDALEGLALRTGLDRHELIAKFRL